jgi:hypothetical protein
MRLSTSLLVSSGATNSKSFIVPQPQGTGFDLLLTQDDSAILTQDGRLLVRQTVLYELETQQGLTLLSQDGRKIIVGF